MNGDRKKNPSRVLLDNHHQTLLPADDVTEVDSPLYITQRKNRCFGIHSISVDKKQAVLLYPGAWRKCQVKADPGGRQKSLSRGH